MRSYLPDGNRDLEAQPYLSLYNFSTKTAAKLEKKYNKSLRELENIINQHERKFRTYQIFYAICALSIAPMAYLQAQLSNVGINTLTKLIFNTTVSDNIGYGLGVPFAIFGTLPLIFVFSPTQKAAERILIDFLTPACPSFSSPKETAAKCSRFLIKKTILIPCNLTGTMSGISGFATELNTLNSLASGCAITTLAGFQYEYYNLSFNNDFSEGLDFFFDKKYPWLYQIDMITALQIIKQGMISSVGLRAYPIYYFLAKSAEEIIGTWFPPLFISITAALQGLGVFYPTTYFRYTKDNLQINDWLKAVYTNIQPTLTDQIQQDRQILGLTHSVSPEELKEHLKQRLKTKRFFLEKELASTQTWKHILKKDPAIGFFLAYNVFIGANIGYEAAPFVMKDAPILITTGCAVAGALLFGELLRRAEFKRARNQMTLEYLEKKSHSSALSTPKTGCEKRMEHLGTLLAVATAALGATSTIGATTKILPANSPGFFSKIIALLAVERGLGIYFFQGQKIRNLVKKIFNKNTSALFQPSNKNKNIQEDKQTSRWLCCCRRRSS